MPEIFLGSDHRGFELKNYLVAVLSGAASNPDENIRLDSPSGAEYTATDLGPAALDQSDDYNDAAVMVSRAVQEHPGSFGILVCGSAHGVAIQANRFKGIRAIAAYDKELAKIGREHNNANVLCLSADFTAKYNQSDLHTAAREIVTTFLSTDFSNESRHIRRNQRLDEEQGTKETKI